MHNHTKCKKIMKKTLNIKAYQHLRACIRAKGGHLDM